MTLTSDDLRLHENGQNEENGIEHVEVVAVESVEFEFDDWRDDE